MTKKIMTAALVAAMTVIGATAVMAESTDTVDVEGIKFSIPEDVKELVTVQTEGLDDDTLVSVSETASIEAAEAMDGDTDGAGWLFSISRVSEDEMKNIRCNMIDGQDIFAEDDDIYYVFNHPTDVRMVRESNEKMEEDREDWIKLNDWAHGTVCDEILANNSELDAKKYTNTAVDGYLCMAYYRPETTKFELKCLDFGGETPEVKFADEYLEELVEDVTYESVDDPEDGTDGEYIVLNFPDAGLRLEFLKGNENLIREVHVLDEDNEEYAYYYEATFEDADKTATGIMQEWVDAIKNGTDDDADEDDD